MNGLRSLTLVVAAGALLLANSGPASAAYPDKAIKLICPQGVGSGADLIVRYFARKLERLAGQPVIVENRLGGNMTVAVMATIAARPDGYTLGMFPTNTVASNPLIMDEAKYDPLRDLAPVTSLFRAGFAVVVSSQTDVKTVADLTTRLKARGGAANFPVDSAGSLAISALYFRQEGLKDAVRVNYKGTPDVLQDLVGGNLDFGILGMSIATLQAKQGRIRILASTTKQRTVAAPDLPTMAELGYKDLVVESLWGAWFPRETPADVTEKVKDWINQILAEDETKAFLANITAETVAGDPASLGASLREEIRLWTAVSQMVNLKQQ